MRTHILLHHIGEHLEYQGMQGKRNLFIKNIFVSFLVKLKLISLFRDDLSPFPFFDMTDNIVMLFKNQVRRDLNDQSNG